MHKMFLFYLVLIIQINGQAIVRDECQSQTTIVNDLWMKFRKFETDYMQLQNRIIKLEEELHEIKGISSE